MIKKIIIAICIFMVTMYLTSCNIYNFKNNTQEKSDELDTTMYEYSTLIYIDKEDINDISIQYPVISGLSNKIKQQKINDTIKANALKVYNYYDYPDREHLDLDIEYLVSLKSDCILSIQYFGLGYIKGAAHPNKLFYTTTIDIKTGNRLRLLDLVNVEEGLLDMFVNGEFKPLCPKQEESALELYKNYDELKKLFINADNMDYIGTDMQSDVFSYLTKDSLGISVPVAFAIGGHAEFEIEYDKIKEYLKINPKYSYAISNY